MTTTQSLPRLQAQDRLAKPQEKLKWVKLWAFGGVVWIGMCVYSVTKWLLGGYAHPVPTGPDPMPTYMKVAVHGWTVVWAGCLVAAVYFFLYKPWRRDGRIGQDGLFIIAFGTMFMLDPAVNFSQVYYVPNGHIPNLGCPQCFLPGWQSSAVYTAEGVFQLLWYPGFAFLCVVLGCKLMSWFPTRWPKLGRLGPVGVVFVSVVVFDILTELIWVLPGTYIYTGASRGPGPVLFAGHYYQFPLYEPIFAAAWYFSFVLLRFYKNDRGQTIAERGLESLRGTERQRTGVQLLALIGACNFLFILSYAGPLDWISRRWNDTPKDISSRSYFMGANCGPESKYACPDRRIPMHISDQNLYVTPDGKVVAPSGVPVQRGGE